MDLGHYWVLFLLLPHARLGNYFMFWSLHFGSCKMGILIVGKLGALAETQMQISRRKLSPDLTCSTQSTKHTLRMQEKAVWARTAVSRVLVSLHWVIALGSVFW